MGKAIYIVTGVLFVCAVAAYSYHVWSDCLGENSVFTCVRMLN